MQKLDKDVLIKKILAEKGPLRFKDIVKETGLSEPTVAKWLKKLEEKGEIGKTLLPNKEGVYYVLLDPEFKAISILMGELLIRMFERAKELSEKFKVDPGMAISWALGECINYIRLIGYDDPLFISLGLSYLFDGTKLAMKPSKSIEEVREQFFQDLKSLKLKKREELDAELDRVSKALADEINKFIKYWIDKRSSKEESQQSSNS